MRASAVKFSRPGQKPFFHILAYDLWVRSLKCHSVSLYGL